MIVWFRQNLLRILQPVLAWGASLHHNAAMSPEFVEEAMKLLQPGDVLVSRIDGNLANHLIPGFYTHAAMYIGQSSVMEATGQGVHPKHIAKFLFDKDHVAILRPKFANSAQASDACVEVMKLDGEPYDYDFTGNNSAWYCSEIIWYGYDQVVKPSPFTKRKTWGVETVTPQDFYQATQKFDLVTKFGVV